MNVACKDANDLKSSVQNGLKEFQSSCTLESRKTYRKFKRTSYVTCQGKTR